MRRDVEEHEMFTLHAECKIASLDASNAEWTRLKLLKLRLKSMIRR